MAETLSYDSGTDTVTVGENLTPDEQDSLAVGEEMEQQQEQLLAGKYKNAEELEKAYAELERKLGDSNSEDTETEEDTEAEYDDETESEYDEDIRPNAELISSASEEFFETGEVSEETMAQFNQMSSQDLVNAYVAMSQANPQQQQQGLAEDLSSGDINSIKNSVGGDAEYANMVNWASNNLDRSTVEAFDSLLDSGNTGAIQLAVNGLRQQYETANGYEGRMLQGKPPKSSGDVFRSQPELVEAMSDPRYDRDPAYRQDVIEKLDRSDLSF